MTQTIFKAYNGCKEKLKAAGIEDYVFDSKQIIKYITGYTNTQILTNYNDSLTDFQQKNLDEIIEKRVMRYPLQYIFGKWNFYGHDFFVGPGVLIPRADTETLVDVCLEHIEKNSSKTLLDLCAGSGCIGITLAAEKKDTDVILLEKYNEAIAYIEKNIKLNNVKNVKTFCGDVFSGELSDKKYDLIVSNPPYISEKDMKNLQAEVRYEPETALSGGKDGLDFYKAIIDNYKASLNDNGMLAFEVGIGQSGDVKELMEKAGFENIGSSCDIAEIERVVFGTVKSV